MVKHAHGKWNLKRNIKRRKARRRNDTKTSRDETLQKEDDCDHKKKM